MIALGQPGVDAGIFEFEGDFAIHQQGEKLDARKTVLLPQLSNLLRGRQRPKQAHELRIANPEQGAGTGGLQHHLVAAAPHEREAG